MPNHVVTSEATPLGYFNHDVWGIIICRLPLRQQVQFRRFSSEMRDVVDLNKLTTYAKLLSRSEHLSKNSDSTHPDAIRFFNTWVPNFRFKLKGDELDFFCGVASGNRALVNDLLKKNPYLLTLCDIHGNTAFHYAAACGQPEIFHDLYHLAKRENKLLAKRVSVITRKAIDDHFTFELESYLISRENADGESAIDWIIRYGQMERFKKIFDLKSGSLALKGFQQKAARYGKQELLFEQGLLSDPKTLTQANQQSYRLLHIAARYGQWALLTRFMQDPHFDNAFLRKRENSTQLGANVFHFAVMSGNEALVDDLLKRDPSLISSIDLIGRPALYYAVASDQLRMVKKFYALQPHAIIQDNEQLNGARNLTYCAIEQGNLEVLKFLLEQGARMDYHYLNNLCPAVKKFVALKKRGADAKELQKYRDMVVYCVNYFAIAVKEKKYNANHLQIAYDKALTYAVENEADELLPILTAAGALPTNLYFLRNTSEKEKQALPALRRKLIDDYQKKNKARVYRHYAKVGLIFLGVILAYLLLYALTLGLAIWALLGLQMLYPSLLLMPVIAQCAIYGSIGVLVSLVPSAIWYYGYKYSWGYISDLLSAGPGPIVDENRQLSSVNNVTPLYDPLLSKQYYLEPFKVSAKPGFTVEEIVASPAAVLDKNKEAVVENPASEKKEVVASAPKESEVESVKKVESLQAVTDSTEGEREVLPPCLKA